MRLPNAARAFVDIEKLRNYCLNPHHPRGKNKARIFASLLEFDATQSDQLYDTILKAILVENALIDKMDAFGQRYTVDFNMTGAKKNVTIRTAWIVRVGEDFPRLTSCYII